MANWVLNIYLSWLVLNLFSRKQLIAIALEITYFHINEADRIQQMACNTRDGIHPKLDTSHGE